MLTIEVKFIIIYKEALMPMYTITSRENRLYKRIKALGDKKRRELEGLFVVEGLRGVRDAVKNGLRPETVILAEGTELPAELDGYDAVCFAKKLFSELAGTQTPQGIIALFPMPAADFCDLKDRENSFVIVCENVQDPGNLGTIVRTAHCAGASGVILTKGCCDLFNPKTVRSTVASIAAIPVIRSVDTGDAIARLKERGYKIAAGALSEGAVELYGADLSGKIAFIAGNEGNGVTGTVLDMSDIIVKIPMSSDAESLNVGVASAVLMYEKVRQNGQA